MNLKTTWLLTTQILALGMGLLLHVQGNTRAAFWLLIVNLLCVTAWVALDAMLGMRMLRWLQKGNFS
nr:hypothetical protein [Brachymonas sp.]